MTKKDLRYERIKKHGADLNKIFNTGLDDVVLSKKLFSLENKAHHVITCLCNTNTLNLLELNRYTGYDVKQTTEEEQDAFFDKIKTKLIKILGKEAEKVCFINHDPRGYALKIESEYVKDIQIYRDWGGYGIIAPDLN